MSLLPRSPKIITSAPQLPKNKITAILPKPPGTRSCCLEAVCALCIFLMVSYSAYFDHIHVFYYILLILGITGATDITHYPAGTCRRVDVNVTSLHLLFCVCWVRTTIIQANDADLRVICYFAETCVSYKFKCLNPVESNKQIVGRYFIH